MRCFAKIRGKCMQYNNESIGLFSDNPEFKPISFKSLLQYFGGKWYARYILGSHIPMQVNEIVSPFFGGGSFELHLTKRSIKVNGYDGFEPLTNFWKQVIKCPSEVHANVMDLLNLEDRDYITQMKNCGYYDVECVIRRAALFYLFQNTSFCSRGFRGTTRKYDVIGNKVYHEGEVEAWGCMFNTENILNFNNPFVSVEHADFQVSLEKHADMFAYCDPPYPISTGGYGDSREYHEDFEHERLRDVLEPIKAVLF